MTAFWLGRVHVELGRLDQAREQFERVLASAADAETVSRAYAYSGLAEVAAAEGHRDEAERLYTTALELNGSAGDAVLAGRVHQALAVLHRDSGERAAAVEAFERAASCFRGADAGYLREHAEAARDALV
jgi:tetratricopeptide (TPR) repeat protein